MPGVWTRRRARPRVSGRAVRVAAVAADAEVAAPGGRRRPGSKHTSHAVVAEGRRDTPGRVPLTRPERTIREIESRLTRKQVTRMVEDAWQEHRLDKAAVTRLLGYPAEPTRSEFEEAFQRFCQRFGLPKALTLATLHGYEVDALFVAQRLEIQVDGWRSTRTTWRSSASANQMPICSTSAPGPSGSPGNGCARRRSARRRGSSGSSPFASGSSVRG